MGVNEKTDFRKVFITEPIRSDLLELSNYTERIELLTKGGILPLLSVPEYSEQMRNKLSEFDPLQDAIVPTGRIASNVILGMVLRELFAGTAITLGTYLVHGRKPVDGKLVADAEYIWEEVIP